MTQDNAIDLKNLDKENILSRRIFDKPYEGS